jgi:hypothetical protein
MKYTLSTILCLFMSAAMGQVKVIVPLATKIQLDGVVQKDEWNKATSVQLKGGGECLLLHDGKDLHIALRGLSEAWTHIYIPVKDGILVMHASSALGSSLYKTTDGKAWSQSSKFSWALRDPSLSEVNNKNRKDYYNANGWVASTMRMGNGSEIELTFRIDLLADNKLAVVYTQNADSPHYWPETLSDASVQKEVVWGNNELSVQFQPDIWAQLSFQK